MIIIRNFEIENFLIINESKQFAFNRARMRLYDRIIIRFL